MFFVLNFIQLKIRLSYFENLWLLCMFSLQNSSSAKDHVTEFLYNIGKYIFMNKNAS